MTDKTRIARRKTAKETRQCISRLSSVVMEILDEGVDPDVVMEALTVIRRNLSMPVPRLHRLTVALISASLLSPRDLRQLQKWLLARIVEDKREEADIPSPPSRILIKERQYRGATYRLELVRCGAEGCHKCRSAPAHGPYWYLYGDGACRYIGKRLPPKLARRPKGLGTPPPGSAHHRGGK